MALSLKRYPNTKHKDSLFIDGPCIIRVLKSNHTYAQISIECEDNVTVLRGEIVNEYNKDHYAEKEKQVSYPVQPLSLSHIWREEDRKD